MTDESEISDIAFLLAKLSKRFCKPAHAAGFNKSYAKYLVRRHMIAYCVIKVAYKNSFHSSNSLDVSSWVAVLP